ncbi:hypothetical protein [Candidatus Palauibacter sp.]|uniref:hypothetical protein n=1 Tax=Candidatus Palauibacter sp. TaxID=3101350 RepID=UPI003B58DA26
MARGRSRRRGVDRRDSRGVVRRDLGPRRPGARLGSVPVPFIPEARLIPTGRSETGEHGYNVWSPGDYADRAGASLEQTGFFEVEIARSIDRFGPVVQAFSTYESRRNADDPEPFARGINSIQLMHDGRRWYVVTIYWSGERPDLPIPGHYLPSPDGGGAP